MVKKIAIIGPESTGKSTLSESLASVFNTEWVPECARIYLNQIKRPYKKEDLTEIAKEQIKLEEDRMLKANHLLISDTNLIVIKVWSDYKYGHTDPWILENLSQRHYDYYLLTNIDLPWQDDPQREHPHLREYFFLIYLNYLKDNGLPFDVVSGTESKRLQNAQQVINQKFG
ncbi:MAG TPA: AAA family ATPase [Cyclobacteriaceae bacterium]